MGLFKENKPTLIVSLSLFTVILIVGGRSAALGMIHLSDWVFSGIGNEYDGDISDSATLQPLTIIIAVIAIVGLIRGISKINPFIEFATVMNNYATTHMPDNSQFQNTGNDVKGSNASDNILSDDHRSKVEKLKDIKELLDAKILTEEEFEEMKRKILNS